MDYGSFDKTVVPVVEINIKWLYIKVLRCESLYDLIKDDKQFCISCNYGNLPQPVPFFIEFISRKLVKIELYVRKYGF